METWSTERLPAREQFDHWSEVVSEAFVPVAVKRSGAGAFPSRVASRAVGPLRVSRIVSPAQSVLRTAAHVARAPGDTVFLNLPLTSGTFARQGGRTARLAPGDFTIVDGAQPFELGFCRPFVQVSVQLPRELLGAHGLDPSCTARRVDGGRGIGALASGALRSFADEGATIDRDAARTVAEHLCGLIALAVAEEPAPAPRGQRDQLRQAALELIDERLADPDLSPRMVAELISVSPRFLHRLFAEHGTSFGRQLLERRLERGHQALNDPHELDRAVGEVAHACGFSDPSYFARAFRTRYGISPRELRAATRTAAA